MFAPRACYAVPHLTLPLYKTMENVYYVYAYLRPDNSPYYVGKGKGSRAYDRDRLTIPPENKNRIVFLRKGLLEEEAFKWEIFYIKHYGRMDLGTGVLLNRTDGGKGAPNPAPEIQIKSWGRVKRKIQDAIELTNTCDGKVYRFDNLRDAARDLNLNLGNLGMVWLRKQGSIGNFSVSYLLRTDTVTQDY